MSIPEDRENGMTRKARRDPCGDKPDIQSWIAFLNNCRYPILTSEARKNLRQYGLPGKMSFPAKLSIQATWRCGIYLLELPISRVKALAGERLRRPLSFGMQGQMRHESWA